ncbi:MAG: arginine--tRNA ligase [Actinomycetota bacterium]
MIQDDLRRLLAAAIEELRRTGSIPDDVSATVELTRPARPEHGDFSTNLALTLAPKLRRPPRQVADLVIGALPEVDWLSKVEVAGPGFINLFLTHAWLQDTVRAIATKRERFGRLTLGEDVCVQVEFVSANPTGPLHVGAGRNAAYGDALASLLRVAGYEVSREYYINDTGRQIELFAQSLEARYLQALGREAAMPEDGYHGAYLVDLGRELAESRGAHLVGRSADIGEWGLDRVLGMIRSTLDRFGVRFDNWFSEATLHDAGKVKEGIERLTAAGYTYEKDGAVWFRSTDFGENRDRVLIRSNGSPTYLAADVAYLTDKVERGFDLAMYVWGADHQDQVASLQAAGQALGLPVTVEVLLYQLVSLFSGGQEIRMSKRTGEMITLDELIDDVGADAARFTFLLRSLDSDFAFDLDLVRAKSQENPVYYVQYAHARISSILRKADAEGIALCPVEEAPLAVLLHDTETGLARLLADYPEAITVAAKLRAPYRLTGYAHDVAAAFHAFYRDCRVIGEDPETTQARLWLSWAARQVLANTLAILGVSAPEQM